MLLCLCCQVAIAQLALSSHIIMGWRVRFWVPDSLGACLTYQQKNVTLICKKLSFLSFEVGLFPTVTYSFFIGRCFALLFVCLELHRYPVMSFIGMHHLGCKIFPVLVTINFGTYLTNILLHPKVFCTINFLLLIIFLSQSTSLSSSSSSYYYCCCCCCMYFDCKFFFWIGNDLMALFKI